MKVIMSKKIIEAEFIMLVALMTSLGALSIDAILPALSNIASSFQLVQSNAVQQVIGVLFLGMTIGQLFSGPLSDRYGRRIIIFCGIAVFGLGSLISIYAESFMVMLVGRFIQGLGASALRVVPMAVIRDRYEGAAMARIMSLVMMIFIIVPCFAPLLGQLILTLTDWRGIFWFLLLISAVVTLGIWLRLPETLPANNRNLGGIKSIPSGITDVLANSKSRACTIVVGLTMGAFMGYMMSAEQIFKDIYAVGDLFALYFGLSALSIGIASFLNVRLTQNYSPESIGRVALFSIALISSLGLTASLFAELTLMQFQVAIALVSFCLGLVMGNLNAIAMQPFGHIAGLANSVISFVSGGIAMVIGSAIGMSFNMSVQPLLIGLLITSLMSIFVFSRTTLHLGNETENKTA